jgi:hypothetical protein
VHLHRFSYVTKFINVVNRGTGGDEICIAFTSRGFEPTVGNFITLDHSVAVSHEVRTTELYVSCSASTNVVYQIFCGLTTIPAKNFLVLTGSNGHEGVG